MQLLIPAKPDNDPSPMFQKRHCWSLVKALIKCRHKTMQLVCA